MCGMKRKFGSAISGQRASLSPNWIRALNVIMAHIRGFLIRLRTNAILGFNY